MSTLATREMPSPTAAPGESPLDEGLGRLRDAFGAPEGGDA